LKIQSPPKKGGIEGDLLSVGLYYEIGISLSRLGESAKCIANGKLLY
jgi:hypothetical protein